MFVPDLTMRFVYTLAFLTTTCSYAISQVNGYAKVTNISGNVLTLNNVNQTNGTFSAGGRIIIIQMQGATISNNTNSTNFGTLNSLNSAGLYEIATISAVNGAVTSMTLTSGLINSYNVNGAVQIVTFPKLGTTNYNTTANINTTAWNGNVGGVTAFYVNGNLNLFHNISASGSGFRGGAKAGQNGDGCETATYRVAAGDARYASKGEGVYITANGERAGRAKAVNGGGGGIVHNGGGGGGGNYTAGGNGYYGYTGAGYCSATTNAGGQGGLAVSSNASRVFLGGGGGGGQENNSLGSNGANGGGIILISCDTIVLAGGGCGARSITANGNTAANGNNDGCGGGGAGGSIVLNIKGIRASAGCPLTIAANGGNGGNVNDGSSHGSGGGGGQGAIYIKASGPFANTTITTNNGAGGTSNTGGGAPTAGSGSGTSGSGVATGGFISPLPVELTYFKSKDYGQGQVLLSWQTASEVNCLKFEIYHTYNGAEWSKIGQSDCHGGLSSKTDYSMVHEQPVKGMNYYKLKQTDRDGTFEFSNIIYHAFYEGIDHVSVFPNPGSGEIFIETERDLSYERFYLINTIGVKTEIELIKKQENMYKVDVSKFPAGVYFLQCSFSTQKLILK